MQTGNVFGHKILLHACALPYTGGLICTVLNLKGTPMIRELCHDEAILSQRCEAATAEDASVAQDLIDTLVSLDDAGCLAANQIGVTKKVCVYLDGNDEPHVLYNPRVIFGLGAQKMEEACLTHEGTTKSTRYIKAKIGFDEIVDGKLKERKRDFVGFEAQMVQHMIDHFAGKLV